MRFYIQNFNMHKKPLVSAIITVLLMSILFGYSLVFGKTANYNGPIVLDYSTGKNIYTSDLELNKTHLLFKSGIDLTNFKINSSCDTYSKMIYNNKSMYYFELKYFNECNDKKISIINDDKIELYSGELWVISEYKLYDKFVDQSNENIKKIQTFLSQKILQLSKETLSSNVLTRTKQQRILKETQFLQNFLQSLLKQRSEKYLVPVAGYNISTKHSKVPNTWRPYRASYTDGIHHSWDVGSKLWENVRALDSGMIIRVISDFEFSDLDQIKYGNNLTHDDKIENLDILRWNQIWLKTSKWDLVFYSHLQDVAAHIKEWIIVRKWETLWTIWVTGVPQKDYTDYHLHFPIHKNPYNKTWNQVYSYKDYMNWDWYFKGQPVSDVLKYQDEIFEKEY